jgi:hypothetical protein
MFTKLVNWLGMYTSDQYLERVEKASELNRYIEVLEQSANGLPDPTKPIIIFGECVKIEGVSLLRGQQIIVSPSARNAHIQNVMCVGRME